MPAPDDLTAELGKIKQREEWASSRYAETDEMRDSLADVPRLRRCVEAVLKLADELEATPYPDGADVTLDSLPVEVARTDIARGLGRIFRAAITRELTGKEESDAGT